MDDHIRKPDFGYAIISLREGLFTKMIALFIANAFVVHALTLDDSSNFNELRDSWATASDRANKIKSHLPEDPKYDSWKEDVDSLTAFAYGADSSNPLPSLWRDEIISQLKEISKNFSPEDVKDVEELLKMAATEAKENPQEDFENAAELLRDLTVRPAPGNARAWKEKCSEYLTSLKPRLALNLTKRLENETSKLASENAQFQGLTGILNHLMYLLETEIGKDWKEVEEKAEFENPEATLAALLKSVSIPDKRDDVVGKKWKARALVAAKMFETSQDGFERDPDLLADLKSVQSPSPEWEEKVSNLLKEFENFEDLKKLRNAVGMSNLSQLREELLDRLKGLVNGWKSKNLFFSSAEDKWIAAAKVILPKLGTEEERKGLTELIEKGSGTDSRLKNWKFLAKEFLNLQPKEGSCGDVSDNREQLAALNYALLREQLIDCKRENKNLKEALKKVAKAKVDDSNDSLRSLKSVKEGAGSKPIAMIESFIAPQDN